MCSKLPTTSPFLTAVTPQVHPHKIKVFLSPFYLRHCSLRKQTKFSPPSRLPCSHSRVGEPAWKQAGNKATSALKSQFKAGLKSSSYTTTIGSKPYIKCLSQWQAGMRADVLLNAQYCRHSTVSLTWHYPNKAYRLLVKYTSHAWHVTTAKCYSPTRAADTTHPTTSLAKNKRVIFQEQEMLIKLITCTGNDF